MLLCMTPANMTVLGACLHCDLLQLMADNFWSTVGKQL